MEARGPRPLILIVEDDVAVGCLLGDVLTSSGYWVRQAQTGAAARLHVEQDPPDLIILDLVLPDEDGLALCSMLKVSTGVPILICSGTQRRRDAYLALKLGADDFIAKPFDVYDLMARVEALLRRAQPPALSDAAEARAPMQIGSLRIDHASHRVSVGAVDLQLTPTEFRLLVALAGRPDQVVARDFLARQVWGDLDTGTSRTIDVHVGRLRMKLTQAELSAPRIVSVRGFGYKLVARGSRLSSALLPPASFSGWLP